MSDYPNDIQVMFSKLKSIEERAKSLRWSDKRPWKRKTHIWYEHDLLILDLHDLNSKLAKESVKRCVQSVKNFETGALCFITGIGKHSAGGFSKNSEMILKLLNKLSKKQEEWEIHSHGMGRLVLVFNKEKAPKRAKGRIDPTIKAGIVIFLIIMIMSSLNSYLPQ